MTSLDQLRPRERAHTSCRLATLRLDDASVRSELAEVQRSGAYRDSYTEFVCGSWRTCMLWNASGNAGDTRIHDYEGTARQTDLGRRLGGLVELVEATFDVTHLRFARLACLAPGTVVLPHCDYLELDAELYRVHLPLQTSALALTSEEQTVYRMGLGEIWFLDATRPHSIANFSSEDRIHLLLDFAVDLPGSVLRDAPTGTPTFPSEAIVRRRGLRPSEPDEFLVLAKIIDVSNLMDVLAMIIKRYFVAEMDVQDVFRWLIEIAALSGDSDVLDRATWLKSNCLRSR